VQVYADGTTTMSTHERKASIREFYGIVHIFRNLLNNICFAPLLSLIACSLGLVGFGSCHISFFDATT
jgi:hypothetical protein